MRLSEFLYDFGFVLAVVAVYTLNKMEQQDRLLRILTKRAKEPRKK
jgi:hypothetical protein